MDKELMRSKVEEINRLHKEADTRYRTMVNDLKEKVFRIGQLLTECKKEYGDHGIWMAWVEANCEFSHSTANNYMRAYEKSKDPNYQPVGNLKDIYYPQLEHKPTKVKEPQKPVEAKPVIPIPPEKIKEVVTEEPTKLIGKVKEYEEPEVCELYDQDQDEILELAKEEVMKLDKAHLNEFSEWYEGYLEEWAEKEAA